MHGLTPYEKLKKLLGGKTTKDFEVSNDLPLDKNKNSNILKIETSPYSSAVRASGLGCPNPGFLLWKKREEQLSTLMD